MDYSGSVAFSVELVSDGEARGRLEIGPEMLNPFGTVHAGALIWFADVVATTLVLGERKASDGMKGFPLAVNLVTQLMSNRKDGVLTATAGYVKRGRRVSTVRTVVAGEDGRALIELTSTHIAAE
jgi:1,4-dihydroxy-2-naphthoyl-CoA hydrolase